MGLNYEFIVRVVWGGFGWGFGFCKGWVEVGFVSRRYAAVSDGVAD